MSNKKYSNASLWIGTFIFSSLLFLVATELFLRIVAPYEAAGGFNHDLDPVLGWKNPTKIVRTLRNPSFTVEVSTNDFGMRDRERSLQKGDLLRVAFLGDSFVQALQVNDEEVFNILLENLHPGIEALNFGVSAYGTAQQYLQYQTLVKQFSPDIIVVLFWPYNDPFDNSIELQKLGGISEDEIKKRPFVRFDDDGQAKIIRPIIPQMKMQNNWSLFKRFLRDTFYVVSYAWKAKNIIVGYIKILNDNEKIQSSERRKIETDVKMLNAFSVENKRLQQAEWKKAWDLSFKIMKLFNREAAKDGAKLVISTLPVEKIETELDAEELSPSEKIMAKVLLKEDIPFLPLTPCFRKYLQTNNVRNGHYHYEQEGHFRPLGHQVLALCLLKELQSEKIIN